MYVVFVTGGIGSGKTYVRDLLSQKPQASVVDLDAIAREVLTRSDVKRELAEEFGGDVLVWDEEWQRCRDYERGEYEGLPDRLVEPSCIGWDYDGAEVDRALLARRAFASEEDTARLNAITHPRIMAELGAVVTGRSCSCMGGAPRMLVVEVQLIEDAGQSLALADEVLAVACDRQVRRERAVRRGMAPEDFDARDARQIDDSRRAGFADTVLRNEGGLEELRRAVDDWYDDRVRRGLI